MSLVTGAAQAATKVFLHDAASKINPSSGFIYKLANSTQGAAKVTAVTGSTGGPVTGQYWPSAATAHIVTKTSGGTRILWMTPPLSAAVTIAGSIAPNFWGLESAAACNCGLRYEVLRWSAARGGIVASLGITADNGLSEWGTSAAVRTAPTLSPASTTFSAGDRIVIVLYNDDANGVNQGSGRNWTLDYDGPTTGSDGDTYLSFAEALSFAADTNNAPPQGFTSESSPPPASPEFAANIFPPANPQVPAFLLPASGAPLLSRSPKSSIRRGVRAFFPSPQNPEPRPFFLGGTHVQR